MSGEGWTGLAAVAGGGAVGASARYLVGRAVQGWAGVAFPFGTLSVNVSGCLLFGALFVWLRPETAAGVRWHLFLTTGLCGGFTTFSTFSHETAELFACGRRAAAVGYAGLSLAACLGAIVAGGWLAARVLR